jgi:hypothetical protein
MRPIRIGNFIYWVGEVHGWPVRCDAELTGRCPWCDGAAELAAKRAGGGA